MHKPCRDTAQTLAPHRPCCDFEQTLTLHKPCCDTAQTLAPHRPCRDTLQTLAPHRPRCTATGALPRRGVNPAAMPRGAVEAGAALPLAAVRSLFAFHHLWPVLVPSVLSQRGCFRVTRLLLAPPRFGALFPSAPRMGSSCRSLAKAARRGSSHCLSGRAAVRERGFTAGRAAGCPQGLLAAK